jgi:CheY-like chemotaxis protein
MGGDIQVDSEPGRGSTFTFTAQLGRSTTNSVPHTNEHRHDSKFAASCRTSGLRVLLVEDNPVNREVAVAMLTALECEVHVADDGEGALNQLAARQVDVILMDCQMPVMDGFAAAAEIRRRNIRSGGRPVPIVAFTAHALERDREDCLSRGMDGYLSKPYTIIQLEEALAPYATARHLAAGRNFRPVSSARAGNPQ